MNAGGLWTSLLVKYQHGSLKTRPACVRGKKKHLWRVSGVKEYARTSGDQKMKGVARCISSPRYEGSFTRGKKRYNGGSQMGGKSRQVSERRARHWTIRTETTLYSPNKVPSPAGSAVKLKTRMVLPRRRHIGHRKTRQGGWLSPKIPRARCQSLFFGFHAKMLDRRGGLGETLVQIFEIF